MVQIVTDSSVLYTPEEAKKAGFEVINIAMADGLSGTYQSACGAKNMVENGDNVTVINSTTLCGPHRYMVEKAQQMKEAGCGAKEIIEWLEAATKKHESFLIPQDFDFLRRGGRLTPVAATLGLVLKLKPIMTQTPDGKQLDKFRVKRTMKAAFVTQGGPQCVAIQYIEK